MITDTSKYEIHPEQLLGGNSGAIEEQEKRGQQELCKGDQLPYKLMSGEVATEVYKRFGIEITEDVEKRENELFIKVKLPEGWVIKPTEHNMWSFLINEKYKIIAKIFYKAAFYDHDAFIVLVKKNYNVQSKMQKM